MDRAFTRVLTMAGVIALLSTQGLHAQRQPRTYKTLDEAIRATVTRHSPAYGTTSATIDAQFAQEAYLKPSRTVSGDQFGYSVAISGDTAVVGAPFESPVVKINGIDTILGSAGVAYVFARNAEGWAEQARLLGVAAASAIADNFGTSVSISGDTVVVGALRAGALHATGAAYVFVRETASIGTVWRQQGYLVASDNDVELDQFGISVAVSGDTIVVGANLEDGAARGVNGTPDEGADDAGAAYVFERTGDVWTQTTYLKASNADAGDWFGFSVGIAGNTIVVGAWQEDSNEKGTIGIGSNNSASSAGAAYVFVRDGTSWVQQAYLKASNTAAFDNFGYSVAASGDTIVVGSRLEHSTGTGVNGDQTNNSGSAGAAYVFLRDGASWTQQAYLKASNTQAGDAFGSSVAISGEIVVIGALQEDSGASGVNGNQVDDCNLLPSAQQNCRTGSGAAYVFLRNGTSWSQHAYLKASNPGPADNFGVSAAVWGGTVVIGANHESSDATGVNGDETNDAALQAGAAYVFRLPNTAPTITTSGITRWPATTTSNVLMGSVDDVEQGPATLNVSVQSSNPSNGVTLSNLVNVAGSVSADIVIAAGAATTSFVVRVTDILGAFTESTYTVTIVPAVTIAPNVSPAANMNGWHNGQVTVSWTVTNSTSQIGCATTVLSAETIASGATLTCTAANDGGTTSTDEIVRIDLTPPMGTAARSPLANPNGWTDTDVTATFTCSDTLSGVVSTGTSETISSEGSGQSSSYACVDQAGNSLPLAVTDINIDKTPPGGTASRFPLANANGWSNTDVTATFTCTDALSGAVSAGASQLFTTEAADQSGSFLCADLAGNTRTVAIGGISIDRTSPLVVPGSVSATPNPASVNSAIALGADVSDTGPSGLASAEYRIDGGSYALLTLASGSAGSVSGSIGSSSVPAVLNACVRAVDLAGNTSADECTLIAVFDPSGSYVTGAGTIESPPGALVGSTTTGTARFGFQSKYGKGATTPTGSTSFKFRNGDFEFDSTSYDWLVVAGARAQYKGKGVIHNVFGAYDFLLTTIDGDVAGGGGFDKFRLKITGPDGTIYDNQLGAPDSADPTTIIASGHIVIRK